MMRRCYLANANVIVSLFQPKDDKNTLIIIRYFLNNYDYYVIIFVFHILTH